MPEPIPPPIPATPVVVAPSKRPPFEERALWWLIVFDSVWAVPELVANVASVLLSPLCFLGAATPVFAIQRRAGDGLGAALAKAALVGVLAALPFPVTGTAFGAAMLAWTKLGTKK